MLYQNEENRKEQNKNVYYFVKIPEKNDKIFFHRMWKKIENLKKIPKDFKIQKTLNKRKIFGKYSRKRKNPSKNSVGK